ncbi:MAG TPA: 16S rRNA (guanine(527)-N(7))-methyltransferase RsmG [Smithellaceae bacterium]|nr:16S rRNA (guanine(527)-N(7))-methyltransferase RsmG [Smithellaceae bacterium]
MNQDIVFLDQQIRRLNIALHPQQLEQFDVYQSELLQWNARMNLISEKSSREIMTRHFLDSLTALRFITRPDAKIIDVGCGAGFPGLPLKIAQPGLDVFLLEANRKKVSFLKHMIRLLNLSAVHVIHDRAEHLLNTNVHKQNFDFLISRAALKLQTLLVLSEFFLTPQGQLIALKGPSIEREIIQHDRTDNERKIFQLIQYDIESNFDAVPRKIIIGKR